MSKQVYVFLDFDGVINSHNFINNYLNHFQAPTEKTYHIVEHLDPKAIARVNTIVHALNAKVVLSTAWRKAFNVEALREMLESKGFTGEIVGETPVMNCDRGLEIQAWMDDNRVEASQILILDDMKTMLHLTPRQVLTSFYDGGILDRHVIQALELFEKTPLD